MGPRDKLLYACIEEHPGAHLRDIARRAGLTLGVAHEQLGALERRGLVETRMDGRYKRFFPTGAVPPEDVAILIAFRSPRTRAIVAHLIRAGSATQRELATASEVTRGAIAPALRSLRDRGLVVSERLRRENRYRLVDPRAAADVFHRYRESLDPRDDVAAAAAARSRAESDSTL